MSAGGSIESADDVRSSVSVERLADLRGHEETSATREAEVDRLLAESGVFSWPLVVDADSGLILDGSHRARVLGRRGGARFVPAQRVAFDHPALRIGVWCRVVDGVAPPAFEAVRRRFSLVPAASRGLLCHYRGETYGRPDLEPAAAHALARDLARALTEDGGGERLSLVAEDEVSLAPSATDTVVVCPPVLDAGTIRAHASAGRLPHKATRFVLPFRVLGLPVPLDGLAGPRESVWALVSRSLDRPLASLGAGMTVDRRYPERLWQPVEYRIPRTLFADPEDHARYEIARHRAAARAGSTTNSPPGHPALEPGREASQPAPGPRARRTGRPATRHTPCQAP